MAKHATVDGYVDALPAHLRDITVAARAAIDKAFPPGASAIRWAHPTWSIGKAPVCYLKAASHHLTFGFWRGASLDDPSGRLESTGQVMAHVKLRTSADVDATLFAHWISQAIRLEESPDG
jgi:hypothetical protein